MGSTLQMRTEGPEGFPRFNNGSASATTVTHQWVLLTHDGSRVLQVSCPN